jgi:hypothetical protein
MLPRVRFYGSEAPSKERLELIHFRHKNPAVHFFLSKTGKGSLRGAYAPEFMEELDSKLTLFAHYDIEYIDNNHVISAYKNLWWDGPDKDFWNSCQKLSNP